MEKQINSDIEVIAKFKGISSAEDVPDFEFDFFSELHKNRTFRCSKTGSVLVNCVVEERKEHGTPYCEVKCMLENHGLRHGRLCVQAHIKWLDPDYKDGVRNDIYTEKLGLIIAY
jgi:hypothetical protein